MPGINRLPLGLLGFLGIKNSGLYPSTLSETLIPTWDLTDLYTAGNSEVAQVSVNIAAIGSQAAFTVPNGEAWRVLQLSARSPTLGAGQTLQLGLQITDPAGTSTIEVADPTTAVTNGMRCAVALRNPLIAGPGFSLGIDVMQLVAGPVNGASVAIRFARLQL